MASPQTGVRRSGPTPASGRVRVTVYLDEALAEWGKTQEGGLSDLLRRLLGEAQWEQTGGAPDRYPPPLRAAYKRLIDKKLSEGLSAEEESALAGVKQEIDALDRGSLAQRRIDAASAAIDGELSDLRRFLESRPKKRAS